MKTTALVLAVALTSLVLARVTPVYANPADKLTICHGAGQDGTTQYVTLTLSRNAVYQDQGNGGHFYENGTPKAGHEHDYLGECRATSPSASPSANPSANPSATPSTSADPSASSAPTSSSDNSPNSNGSRTSSAGAQVLGAYAETGIVEDVIMNALGSLGGLMTVTGSVLYGKKRRYHSR